MTTAINEIAQNDKIRFNYHGKVREGFVEQFTPNGVTLKLTIDGNNTYTLLDEMYKSFNWGKMGNILHNDKTIIQ